MTALAWAEVFNRYVVPGKFHPPVPRGSLEWAQAAFLMVSDTHRSQISREVLDLTYQLTKLGEGAFRSAYLAPDGWVYKVPWRSDRWKMNVAEVQRWRRVARHSRWAHLVPEYQVYMATPDCPVIAVENLPNSHTLWTRLPGVEELGAATHHCDIQDAFGQNVTVRANGQLVIRDAGNGGRGYRTRNCCACRPEINMCTDTECTALRHRGRT